MMPAMRGEKPPRLDDIELLPDAMERLERAVKIAARQQPAKPGKPRRSKPFKPKPKRSTVVHERESQLAGERWRSPRFFDPKNGQSSGAASSAPRVRLK